MPKVVKNILNIIYIFGKNVLQIVNIPFVFLVLE